MHDTRRMAAASDTLATLSCCITTIGPKTAAAREYPGATAQEQQMVEKIIQALENTLETPLLEAGWKVHDDRTAPPQDPIAGNSIHTERAGPSDQVETQLHFDNWAYAKITAGHDPSYIVNMVVHIRATPQVSADILKKIDWRQIGGGSPEIICSDRSLKSLIK